MQPDGEEAGGVQGAGKGAHLCGARCEDAGGPMGATGAEDVVGRVLLGCWVFLWGSYWGGEC